MEAQVILMMVLKSKRLEHIPPTRYELAFFANSALDWYETSPVFSLTAGISFVMDSIHLFPVSAHKCIGSTRGDELGARNIIAQPNSFMMHVKLPVKQNNKKIETDWFFVISVESEAHSGKGKNCLQCNHKWHLVRAEMQCNNVSLFFCSTKWERLLCQIQQGKSHYMGLGSAWWFWDLNGAEDLLPIFRNYSFIEFTEISINITPTLTPKRKSLDA